MACCDNDLARVATLLASEYEENPGKRKNIDVDFRMTNLGYAGSGLLIWTIFIPIIIMPTAICHRQLKLNFMTLKFIVFIFGMAITMCLFLGVQFIYVDQVFPFWFVLYIYCYLLASTTFALAVKNQYNTPPNARHI